MRKWIDIVLREAAEIDNAWFGPNGEAINLDESHSLYVLHHPATFGLADSPEVADIAKKWQETDEELNYDRLIAMAEANGWVRISHDVGTLNVGRNIALSGSNARAILRALRWLIDQRHASIEQLAVEIETLAGTRINHVYYDLRDADLERFYRRGILPRRPSHQHLAEGRVYRIDWGYTQPVMVITNPSPPQARTLVTTIAERHNNAVYLRGIMIEDKVYVWDGYLMTHDDVHSELLSDVPKSADDFWPLEISNYTVVGLQKLDYHPARCRPREAEQSPFVRNVLTAIDALPPIAHR